MDKSEERGERVLVCGGRDYNDRHHVYNTLMDLISELGMPKCIIHGGATGADTAASRWAIGVGVLDIQFPVSRQQWQSLGGAAGPIRNQRMIDEGNPTLVIAFPGGKGTADMVRRAEKAGIPVRRISPAVTSENAKTTERRLPKELPQDNPQGRG